MPKFFHRSFRFSDVLKSIDGFAKPVTFKVRERKTKYHNNYGSIFSSFLTLLCYICLIVFFGYLYGRMYNLEDDKYDFQEMANTHQESENDLPFLDLSPGSDLLFKPSIWFHHKNAAVRDDFYKGGYPGPIDLDYT